MLHNSISIYQHIVQFPPCTTTKSYVKMHLLVLFFIASSQNWLHDQLSTRTCCVISTLSGFPFKTFSKSIPYTSCHLTSTSTFFRVQAAIQEQVCIIYYGYSACQCPVGTWIQLSPKQLEMGRVDSLVSHKRLSSLFYCSAFFIIRVHFPILFVYFYHFPWVFPFLSVQQNGKWSTTDVCWLLSCST